MEPVDWLSESVLTDPYRYYKELRESDPCTPTRHKAPGSYWREGA